MLKSLQITEMILVSWNFDKKNFEIFKIFENFFILILKLSGPTSGLKIWSSETSQMFSNFSQAKSYLSSKVWKELIIPKPSSIRLRSRSEPKRFEEINKNVNLLKYIIYKKVFLLSSFELVTFVVLAFFHDNWSKYVSLGHKSFQWVGFEPRTFWP